MDGPGIGLPLQSVAGGFIETLNADDYPNAQNAIRVQGCSIGCRPDEAAPIRIYTRQHPNAGLEITAVQVDFRQWVLHPREQAFQVHLEGHPRLDVEQHWAEDGPHHALAVEDRNGTWWKLAHLPPGPWIFQARATRGPDGIMRFLLECEMRDWL